MMWNDVMKLGVAGAVGAALGYLAAKKYAILYIGKILRNRA